MSCSSSSSLNRSEAGQQPLARLFPLTLFAERDLDLPTYTLDARRGVLRPSSQRLVVRTGYSFTVFASGEYSKGPLGKTSTYWVQTELYPAEYAIIELQDVDVERSPETIEPMYVTEARYTCPLLTPRAMRLEPLGNISPETRLYVFYEPNSPSSVSGPPVTYGNYAEPFLNVGYKTPQGQTFLAYIASPCLSHLTPWKNALGNVILINELGSVSEFRDNLVAALKLTETDNVASSEREKMRLNHESCEDILRDIPDVQDALMHNPAGDLIPTATIFLCADSTSTLSADAALVYHMKPSIIGSNRDGLNPHDIALLVVNLSPPNPSTNMEQSVTFGGYSYTDVSIASDMIAIPAFDGSFGEIAPGLYHINAGVRNALWVIMELTQDFTTYHFRYATGLFNTEVLNEYYSNEQPWWDSTALVGKIANDFSYD